MNYVWLNSAGDFLTVSESLAHGGIRYTPSYSYDLQKAYVAPDLPRLLEGMNATNMKRLIAVPAKATRTVALVVNE